MNDTPEVHLAASSSADPAEELIDQLWRLWQDGQAPDVNSLLDEAAPLTPAQLAAVLRADQRQRWQAGERIIAETYLRNYPKLHDDVDTVVDMIYSEFLLRERQGERPDPCEYAQRFPEHAAAFVAQVELHLAILTADVSVTHDGTSLVGDKPTRAVPGRTWPVVPGYEILEELGRGGMGVVYKAQHLQLKRVVALKMLLAGVNADPEQLARFRTEAEADAQLQHANIVQIFEVGYSGGQPFLALEFVNGGNLKRCLGGTLLPGREAARLVETLARAVQLAHERGIVHRDLKPSNVLLQIAASRVPLDKPESATAILQTAIPKITDFGLAKLLERDSAATASATHASTILGTPSYMAPEQATGKSPVGPPADVYALGAILYELLTGRPPFQGESPLDTLQQVIADEPVPPARLQKKIPRDLDTICLKCLEKEPTRRYATAAALAEDLRRFQVGEPIAARPIGSLGRAWRWSRRNPLWAAAMTTVAVLLVVIAVGSLWWSIDLEAALYRARQAEAEAARKLFDSRVSEARARSLSRQPGQRFASLALLDEATRQARDLNLPATVFHDLRNATLAALIMPDLNPVLTAAPCGDSGWCDFDDRLEIFVHCEPSGTAKIRRVDTGVELYSISDAGHQPRLSRDARYVAVSNGARQSGVWALERAARQILSVENTGHVVFHANNRQIAMAHDDGSISVYDLPDARLIKRFAPQTLTKQNFIALHPTEPLIAVGSYFGTVVHIRNVQTGRLEKVLEVPDGCSSLAWHPSGAWLALSDGNGPNIQVWDRATWKLQRRLGPVAGGARIYFNHAGDRLATYDWIVSVRLLDFATGQLLFQVSNSHVTSELHFAADDRRLAGFRQDQRLGFWEVGDGQECRRLTHQVGNDKSYYHTPTIHPDGRVLAVATGTGAVLWDLDTGLELATLPCDAAACVHFEPSGNILLTDRTGVYRWPVERDRSQPDTWRIGPPQPLDLPPGAHLVQSRDGKVLATRARDASWEVAYSGVWILHPDAPAAPRLIEPGADIGDVALSPDGKWLVTAVFPLGRVTIWNTRTGVMERNLIDRGNYVTFSPDGHRLIVASDPSRLFSVPDWKEEKALPGTVRIASDNRTAVSGTFTHAFSLLDVDSSQVLARFEHPSRHNTGIPIFTPDGTRLITTDNGSGPHVWDLRSLRRQLAERGLDWHAKPYPEPSAEKGKNIVTPMRITVDAGDYFKIRQRVQAENHDRAVAAAPHLWHRWFYRSQIHQQAGRIDSAIKDLQAAVKLPQCGARAYNELAWHYVTGPEKLRDLPEAIRLAEHAVKLKSGHTGYANTLGIAYYRSGRFVDAAATFEKNLKSGAQYQAYDLYFLALAQHHLGRAVEARDSFAKGRAWQDAHATQLAPGQVEELRLIRAEVEATLALKASVKER
jgi:WD40 repeat protein/Tfp pilus assembly protein PilF